jgi:hypothetical protein
MDHADIEEADLVSRYLLHRLSAEEEQAFEAHIVDCPACLDRLDETKRLRDGLRTLATDAALHTSQSAAAQAQSPAQTQPQTQPQAQPPALAPAFARRPFVLGLALAASVVLGVGLAIAVARIAGLDGELTALRQDQSRIEARNRDLERQAGDLQQQIDRRPPQTAPQSSPQTAPQTAPQSPPQIAPQTARPAVAAGVPVVALSITRGAPGPGSAPPVQIARPSASPFVVLLLDLGSATSPSYRVAMTNARGEQLWTGEHLSLTTPAELAVAIPATLLRPGDYVVQVDAERRDARPPLLVGHFAFRVR